MRKLLIAIFFMLAAGTAALTLLAGCEAGPEAPIYENPFDAEVPGGGNPLGMTATLVDSLKVLLSWSQPQGYNIDFYEIAHSYNLESGFLSQATVTHTSSARNTFTYRNADPTEAHFFRIKAYNTSGEFTNLGSTALAITYTPPLVYLTDGNSRVGRRDVSLDITVTQGDSLKIWLEEDPDGALFSAAPEPGVVGNRIFTLPEVAGNDTTFHLQVIAFPLTVPTDTASLTLTVDFDPVFSVEPDSAAVVSRDLELLVPDQGIIFMRFADTREGLVDQDWEFHSESFSYRISDSANPQVIWGEFVGDFGFPVVASLGVTPATLADASFSLDLEADHLSDSEVVTILSEAAATQMRFGEGPDLSGTPWLPYAEEHEFSLSSTPGYKTIYGQFRNDWANSPILTDYVVYLAQDLEVAFTAPHSGDTLIGGVPLLVRGRALATASIDSVKFDAGDGEGFRSVTGTENWSYLWNVPEIEESTEVVLRARAWDAGDSVTTTCPVQILMEDSPE